MSPDLKDSFKTFNEDGLCAYFEKIIDKNKYGDVMLAFGIPPTAEKNPQALRRALMKGLWVVPDRTEEDVAVAAIAAGKARFEFGEKPDV